MKLLLSLLLISACHQIIAQATSIGATTYDQAIDARYKPDGPGGVALVAKGDKIIYQRAFGMANLELNVPMSPDMVFSIGSMGKQVTAVCILQLMEQGKLKLSDSINLYLKDCPAHWQPVTIEHLLTHTSGITDEGGRPILSSKEMISQYQDKPLTFQPGSRWSYSSAGYHLLGLVVEKVSGISFGEYIQKNIITPLQLTRTYLAQDQPVIPNRASSYLGAPGRYRNPPRIEYPFGGGGPILSTTGDMMKWTRALAEGKLLKKETVAKAWSPYILSNGKSCSYGYGWQAGWNIEGKPIIQHSGSAGGFQTDAVYFPKEDIYVAVFINLRGILPEIVVEDLAFITLGKPDMRKPISLTEEALKEYIGVYLRPDSSRIYLTIKNHQLSFQGEGPPAYALIPFAKDQFFFNNSSALGIFSRDDKGQLIGFKSVDKRDMDSQKQFFKKSDLPMPAVK